MAKQNSLEKECERLRKRIARLELQRKRDRRSLETLRSSRDTYKRYVYALLKEQHGRDVLERWAREEPEGLPLNAFIGELEAIVAQKTKGIEAKQRRPA